MRIIFIGTVEFSYRALEALIEHNFDVVGVITKRKSDFNADFCDLTPLTDKYQIPTFFRKKDNEEDLIAFLKDKNPDVIYCFGWSHILPSEILSIPKYGVVGFHPAELPNNRGRHPLIWAIFLGLKRTASTFFIMDEGADTGDIISQEIVPIEETDTAETLYKKVGEVAIKQIIDFSKEFELKGENIERRKQNIAEGNVWRKRGKIDGQLDFRMSSEAIYNLVRALTHPYVGAHIKLDEEKEVKIWKVIKKSCTFVNYEPGKVLEVENNKILIKTYDGAIQIVEHEFLELPKKGQYL
ncbi:formyltransferase family protein [uncultured Capnocytophaga sp.]|uniref:formyltransferase family protein n=1 Tax=uncultured Capnocytophaga sp. TaxID=159273 RepID=UPI002593301F|nr:formyltransferase family protein [uncultured Capnocytophaga sp.]